MSEAAMGGQDLRLVGVADDGMHLLLASPGGERHRLPIDAALRSAIRHERPRPDATTPDKAHMNPRQVQALIRAGASTDEVAELSGWSADKIARYEGPIIAEREHVAGLATSVRLRSSASGTALLAARVAERLAERGVDASAASWDAWRAAGAPWTLALTFPAGGRLREARWHFDLAARSVEAVDDEARWLSGDDAPAHPEPLVPIGSARRVYDVEIEGGIHSPERADDEPIEPIITPTTTPVARPTRSHEAPVEDSALVASMRERSRARKRSRRAPAKAKAPRADELIPGTEDLAAAPASPVAEIDAVVEAAPASEPVMPQPASEPEAADAASVEPTPADAEMAGPDATVEGALPQGGPVSASSLAADTETAPAAVRAPDAQTSESDQDDFPAVEMERTTPTVVPVGDPHPQVPSQVGSPALDDEADHDTDQVGSESADAGPANLDGTEPDTFANPVPPVAGPGHETSDDAIPVSDRTTGTRSRADGTGATVNESAAKDSASDAPEPTAAEAPGSEAPGSDEARTDDSSPAPNRSQRRAQQRRKSGRPSVPSWDDIMFGAKKDD